MTKAQLHRQIADLKPGVTRRPYFNCVFETRVISSVTLASWESQVFNASRPIEVPFLTDKHGVQEGEELLLKVTTQKK
eukprot:1594153-Karenia_brevis.AAC.1